MNGQQAHSAVRFLESMQKQMEQLMRVGDVASNRGRRSTSAVDDAYDKAKELLETDLTVAEIARQSGMNPRTLARRMRLDGLPTDRRVRP